LSELVPRFPPLRLLGRLPPEHATSSFNGRHPRTINRTGHPVKFELTEQTREAIDNYLKARQKHLGDYLFEIRNWPDRCISMRQCTRLVWSWIAGIGLDPQLFGTHPLRRTKVTLIYRRTGNLRAVQLLLGHTK